MSAIQTAMHDDGVIKYSAEWHKQPLDDAIDLSQLIYWRQAMFTPGLIGEYPSGIGYGNISRRADDNQQFYVSGSATGGLDEVDASHFSLVTGVDIDANRLWCCGGVIASSESMSHAVIYQNCPRVNGIIHVHHKDLWEKLLNEVPSTPPNVAYGTPEMARSIVDLIEGQKLCDSGVFVMAGHEDGVFSFGPDLPAAADRLMRHYDTL